MSERRRVVLHVGLPKTGTTHLQATLARHREALAGRGVSFPDLGPEAMFRGAVEVRGSWEAFGLSHPDVAGRWQALCDHARAWDGVTVISHEILAGASTDEVARALAPLDGLEVHVVLTVRDLGRLATAFWQERVKLGEPWTFAELSRVQIEPELAGERPAVRTMFWHAYDLADCVRRWAGEVGGDRVHIAVAPSTGAPPDELWRRFALASGLEAETADLDPAPRGRASNRSLGRTQVALLREVHAAVGERLTGRQRALLVKRGFAEQVLPGLGGREPARTPVSLLGPFTEVTDRWVRELGDLGAHVVGDVADLAPVCGTSRDPHPDAVDPQGLRRLAAQALAATALRPPANGPSDRTGTPPSPRRGWIRRLTRRRS